MTKRKMVAMMGNTRRARSLPTTPSTKLISASTTISQKFWKRPGISRDLRTPRMKMARMRTVAIHEDRRVLVTMKPRPEKGPRSAAS